MLKNWDRPDFLKFLSGRLVTLTTHLARLMESGSREPPCLPLLCCGESEWAEPLEAHSLPYKAFPGRDSAPEDGGGTATGQRRTRPVTARLCETLSTVVNNLRNAFTRFSLLFLSLSLLFLFLPLLSLSLSLSLNVYMFMNISTVGNFYNSI